MNSTVTVTAERRGRVSQAVFEAIQKDIASGKVSWGEYLPTEMDLAERFSVAPMTARKALKMVEATGQIQSERGHGYRVTARANDPTNGHPVALIFHEDSRVLPGRFAGRSFPALLFESLRSAAKRRGWPLLLVETQGLTPEQVVERCRSARVWSAILDTPDERMVAAAAKAGLGVVLIEEWEADVRVDTVQQDNFGGGYLAARHLLKKGHRQIGWFGHHLDTINDAQRLAGAQFALIQAGVALPPDWMTVAPEAEMEAAIRERMSRPGRPTGVLALWRDLAVKVARVARDMGLAPGRDMDLVGWCAEQQYGEYVDQFDGGPVPATVVWDIDAMAKAAIARLAARRAHHDLPISHAHVEVLLREGASQGIGAAGGDPAGGARGAARVGTNDEARRRRQDRRGGEKQEQGESQ